MTTMTSSRSTVPVQIAVVVIAGAMLGVPGGLAATAVVLWGVLGTPSRPQVLALAGMLLMAVTIGWIAEGVPTPQQVGSFTNLGGRDWLDGLTRSSLGVAAGALGIGRGASDDDGAQLLQHSFRDESGPASPQRLPEVDRMRAIAIVTVVLIHGLPFRAPITDYLDYWLSDLTRFAVPTLLVLAGWLVPQRRVGWAWVRRRLVRLLPAYLIATIFMLTLARLAPSVDARPLLQSVLLGDTVGPYYFIPILVVLVGVTPLVTRLSSQVLTGLTILAIIGSLTIEVADLSLYAHNHHPLTWLPWYLVGIGARPHRDRLVTLASIWWVPAIMVAAVMALGLAFLDIETTPRRIMTWGTMWTTVAALTLGAMHHAGPTSTATTTVSRASYVTYLYHPPVMAGLTGVFGSAFITLRPVTATAVAVALGTTATILAGIALSPRGARWFGAPT